MILFGSPPWPAYFFAFGIALAIGILLRRSRKYFSARARWQRDQAHAPRVVEPQKRILPTNLDKPLPMQRWEVELHESARTVMAQLDSKMILLQHLLRDAEQMLARFKQIAPLPAPPVATDAEALAATPLAGESVAAPAAQPACPSPAGGARAPAPLSGLAPASTLPPADSFHAAYRVP
ncbi:MAG TPA: hypothetical protein VFE24_09295 [Pirellulales bacterium]|jgi:hypothetical protein|nr:hypothetical protein [Pirellulales bacterium]